MLRDQCNRGGRIMKCVVIGPCIAMALAFGAAPVGAADWQPTERINLITHATPGASVDVFLRKIGDLWAKNKIVAQPTSVENITGTAGDKARRHVAVQNKGNAHMLFAFSPQMVNSPILRRSDINVKSFTPIAILLIEPNVLYVHTESPFKSVKDLIEAAQRKPKAVLQGGGAYGGPPSLMGKMFMDEAKVEFGYTPFRSSGEAVVALLGQHVQFMMEQPAESEQHVKAGKLRMLATSVPLAQHPSVPTFASLGYKFRVITQFRGLMAPPGISPDAASYYIRALDRLRATDDWKAFVKGNDQVERWIAGQEMQDFLIEEENVYRKLNAELGLIK